MNRLAIMAVLAASLVACAAEDEGSLDSKLTIENASSYTFIEINLSPTSQVSWGQDLLGADVMEPGDVLEASGIECDTYDIRVIDEDQDECILQNVDLCLDDARWVIDDTELAICAL